MPEPDGVMNGPAWPSDWQTGWVTWQYSDMSGVPLAGSILLSLSVGRAASPQLRSTVVGGTIEVPLANGKPSGPRMQLNPSGIPCIEVPRGDDPDVIPTGIQLVAQERFTAGGGTQLRKLITAEHTLENPLWLSGDLESIAAQPGVVVGTIWLVPFAASGIPGGVQVGDLIFYRDTGELTEVTEV